MSFNITGKLEINLLDADTSPQKVSEFVIKHRIPAIVASPEYMAPLAAHRGAMGGRYQLIAALDFHRGVNWGMDKLFRANPDFIIADGFDILLTPGKTEVESKNEMRSIFEYLKGNRPLCNIRWCLKMHSAKIEETVGILKNMKKFPPAFVRVDHHLEIPQVTADKLKSAASIIREQVPFPIKVCGNIDLETLNKLEEEVNIKRFDVSMKQAESIIRTLKMESMPDDMPTPKPVQKGPAVKRVGNIGRIRLK